MRCTWEYQKLKWQNYQFWGIPIPYNITLTGPNTIRNNNNNTVLPNSFPATIVSSQPPYFLLSCVFKMFNLCFTSEASASILRDDHKRVTNMNNETTVSRWIDITTSNDGSPVVKWTGRHDQSTFSAGLKASSITDNG